MAKDAPLCGFLLAMIMIFVQAFCASIILFFALKLKLYGAIIALFFFILYIDRYCLSIFDVIEGYPSMHPLLTLVHCPALLRLLPVLGKPCLTLLFLLLAAATVTLLHYKNRYAVLLFLCALSPWFLSIYMHSAHDIPSWVHRIKPLPYMVVSHVNNGNVVLKTTLHTIKQHIALFNSDMLCILPESAIDLENNIFDHDFSVMDNDKHHCILGASYRCHEQCYNAFVHIYQGKISHCFHKKHAMLLSERLPTLLHNSFIKQLFFAHERQQIMRSSHERITIDIPGIGSFVPYICSEFFFTEHPDDEWDNIPIIVLVNDSLFLCYSCSRYISDELRMLARFKAIQWQRDIVYVSYSQSFYCGKSGELMIL